MKLFLIGFMGAGKSSLAKKLANKLQLPFIDLDNEIANKKKLSIGEIFSKYGEEAFRKAENQILQELIQEHPDFVMACGGGTACFFDNMSKMNRNGHSIFLDVDEKLLYGRLKKAKDERPLISNLSDQELKDYIHTTLQKRRPSYESAHLVISDNKMKLSSLLDSIRSLQKN